MATNIERFDLLTGRIFADLYEEFPVHRLLTVEKYSTYLMGLDPDFKIDPVFEDQRKANNFFFSTMDWLIAAGYISCRIRHSHGSDTVLTARGLEALKSVPDSLTGKESLGAQLIDAAREGATGRVKELAGATIGAGVRLGIGLAQSMLS